MKVIIEKEQLLKQVQRCSGAIDRTKAQLVLEARETDEFRAYIQDSAFAISTQENCTVEEEGRVSIKAGIFFDIVKELPSGMISLSTSDKLFSIRARGETAFEMKLPVLEMESLDIFENTNWHTPFSLLSMDLKFLLEQVAISIAQDSIRNYAAVAYIHRLDDKRLRIVGSDGYRLSLGQINQTVSVDYLDDGICLSRKAIQEMARLCASEPEQVNLQLSEDRDLLKLYVASYELYLRLVAIDYPDYRGVLEIVECATVELPRQNFQKVAKRVGLGSDKTRAMRMKFQRDQLELTSFAQGFAECKETMPINYDFKSNIQIAINGRYLSEVINAVPSEELKITLQSDTLPIVIEPHISDQKIEYMHVLMPIIESY